MDVLIVELIFAVIALIVNLINDNMIVVLVFTMVCINGLILINYSTEGLENKITPKEVEKETIPISNLHTKENREVLKKLEPFAKAMEGLDVDKVNQMIGHLNKIIAKF